MFPAVEKLREEILNAESVRSDLLKWKLGLIGAIGASGLGLAGSSGVGNAELVLAAIPPVALYVDLLCLHLTLRILVIGAFVQRSQSAGDPALAAYEAFADRARRLPGTGTPPRPQSAFDLEDWALFYSTYGLSAAIGAYGVVRLVQGSPYGSVFVASAVVGLLAIVAGRRQYAERCRKVGALEPTA